MTQGGGGRAVVKMGKLVKNKMTVTTHLSERAASSRKKDALDDVPL